MSSTTFRQADRDASVAAALGDHHDLVIDLEEVGRTAAELTELSGPEVHLRVEEVLAYLNRVLHHAHAEESVLFPLVDGHRHGPSPATAPLHAEHDTVREGIGHLRELAGGDLTTTTRAEMAGLLAGIHLMLIEHFAREKQSYEPLLHD